MSKATKIDTNTWHYRGFTIVRNYISPRGTWSVCSTQQGYCVTPGRTSRSSGIDGDWVPSIKRAIEDIDEWFSWLYGRYDTLSSEGKCVVDQARRIACERGETTDCTDPEQAVIEVPVSSETAGSMLDEHGIDDCDRDDALVFWADALRDALERDTRASRLEVSAARGQRIMHHAWNGAAWSERWSGCATMDTLTDSESAAVEDAITAADAALADFAARMQQQADV